jgi:hypothetical protein
MDEGLRPELRTGMWIALRNGGTKPQALAMMNRLFEAQGSPLEGGQYA